MSEEMGNMRMGKMVSKLGGYMSALLTVIIINALFCPVIVRADAASYWYEELSVDYFVEITAPDGGANLRYGPGVEYEIMLDGVMTNGTVLHVTSEAAAANGNYWGYTEYNGIFGWVALTQVTMTDNPAAAVVEELPVTPLPETVIPTQEPTAKPTVVVTATPTPKPTQTPKPKESESLKGAAKVTSTPDPTTSPAETPRAAGISSSMLITFLVVAIILFVVVLTVFIIIFVKYKNIR